MSEKYSHNPKIQVTEEKDGEEREAMMLHENTKHLIIVFHLRKEGRKLPLKQKGNPSAEVEI